MRYEIWDKTTPVNDIPADEFVREHGIREGDQVYLICNGTRAMVVQTDSNSPYAKEGMTIEEMAEAHLESFNQR